LESVRIEQKICALFDNTLDRLSRINDESIDDDDLSNASFDLEPRTPQGVSNPPFQNAVVSRSTPSSSYLRNVQQNLPQDNFLVSDDDEGIEEDNKKRRLGEKDGQSEQLGDKKDDAEETLPAKKMKLNNFEDDVQE